MGYLFAFIAVFYGANYIIAVAKIGSVQTGIVYYTLPLFSGIEAYFFCWRRGFAAAGLRRNIGGVENRFGEF